MTTRNSIVSIMLTAVVTCGLALALFAPASVSAVEPVQPARITIQTPTLTLGTISIVTKMDTTKTTEAAGTPATTTMPAGDIPTFSIVATNQGQTAAEAKFVASVTVTTMRDAMSRVMRVTPPQVVDEYTISLAPGETKTITLKVPGKVEAMGSVSVALRSGGKEVVTDAITMLQAQTKQQVAQ